MNGYDFDGNLHGSYLEKNPDGSIKKKGHYVHGIFYTGNSFEKKQDPVRHNLLRALNYLNKLPLQTTEQKAQYKKIKQSVAHLYHTLGIKTR